MFAAFRDRTAGRLDLTYQEVAGFVRDYTEYTFLLDGSDTLVVLRGSYTSMPAGGSNLLREFDLVQS